LTGKCLTDEGFAQFIDDLIECIWYRDEAHPAGLAKVTEVHLQGNNLTIYSLPKLGEVIAKSPGDLRELDLSNNNIRVVTAEEKAIWKSFLCCFKNCYVLMKLDLSGNPLGVAGLEILASVYIKSDLEYLEADADAIVRENLGLASDSVLAGETGALKIGENSSKENTDPRSGMGRSKKSPNKGGKTGKQNGMCFLFLSI
jgi:Leucine-rich repeat (LRR) protein